MDDTVTVLVVVAVCNVVVSVTFSTTLYVPAAV